VRKPGPQPSKGISKHEQARAFQAWREQQNPLDFLLFSNGSKLPNGRTGTGWVLTHMGKLLATGRSPQGIFVEAFDAEAAALTEGRQAAL
jgi:hypothetical protein